jgi:hypothetical protein
MPGPNPRLLHPPAFDPAGARCTIATTTLTLVGDARRAETSQDAGRGVARGLIRPGRVGFHASQPARLNG